MTVAGCLLVGCGDDEQQRAQTDASVSSDAADGVDAAGAIDADRRPDAAGTGEACGGFAGAACAEGLYCDWSANDCGAADGQGTCRERPTGCTEEYDPVCGCDGEVYGNACNAHAGGTDLSVFNNCPAPAGYFACGAGFCSESTAYCRRTTSDVAGLPDDFECVGLPAGCGAEPDCDCVSGEPCADACTADADGNLTLTCPGG